MHAATKPDLPAYQSYKKVWALKIGGITQRMGGGLTIIPADEEYSPFTVPAEFVPRHRDGIPEVGWYWVKYEDGYQSFSPAKAFEESYTRI